jgi:hypothetical protein
MIVDSMGILNLFRISRNFASIISIITDGGSGNDYNTLLVCARRL